MNHYKRAQEFIEEHEQREHCRNCIHSDICDYWEEEAYRNDNDVKYDGEVCMHFKPESRFVELPCEIGQVVFAITGCSCEDIDGVHTECEFYGYGTDDRICALPNSMKCPYQYRIEKCCATDMNILMFKKSWGKKYFPSYEEAEKALLEAKN